MASVNSEITCHTFFKQARHDPTDGKEKTDPISSILQGVQEGQRNDSATKIVGSFHKKRVAPEVIRQVLINWNQNNIPPMDEGELLEVFNSVNRYPNGRTQLIRTPLNSVVETVIKWRWASRLVNGRFHMFDGDPAIGKTITELRIASDISTGRGIFNDPKDYQPKKVLLFLPEDDPGDTIKPRLKLMGADMNMIEAIEGVREYKDQDPIEKMFNLIKHLEYVEEILAEGDDLATMLPSWAQEVITTVAKQEIAI